jgi:hypothetical protein
MSAELAWPAKPSTTRAPPALHPNSSDPSSPALHSPSSPAFLSSPRASPRNTVKSLEGGYSNARGSERWSSPDAEDVASGSRNRAGSQSTREGKGRQREDEGEETARVETNYHYSGKPLDPRRVARIAQSFGVNISVTPTTASQLHGHQPQSTSVESPRSRQFSVSPSANSTFASHHSPSVSLGFPPPSPFNTHPSSAIGSSFPRPLPQPQYLISILPPSSLRPSSIPASSSSSTDFSRGSLLPLNPSLKSQIGAIAKEWGLPSTVGLIVFLVYGDAGAKKDEREDDAGWEIGPKIGGDSWSVMWSGLFSHGEIDEGRSRTMGLPESSASRSHALPSHRLPLLLLLLPSISNRLHRLQQLLSLELSRLRPYLPFRPSSIETLPPSLLPFIDSNSEPLNSPVLRPLHLKLCNIVKHKQPRPILPLHLILILPLPCTLTRPNPPSPHLVLRRLPLSPATSWTPPTTDPLLRRGHQPIIIISPSSPLPLYGSSGPSRSMSTPSRERDGGRTGSIEWEGSGSSRPIKSGKKLMRGGRKKERRRGEKGQRLLDVKTRQKRRRGRDERKKKQSSVRIACWPSTNLRTTPLRQHLDLSPFRHQRSSPPLNNNLNASKRTISTTPCSSRLISLCSPTHVRSTASCRLRTMAMGRLRSWSRSRRGRREQCSREAQRRGRRLGWRRLRLGGEE